MPYTLFQLWSRFLKLHPAKSGGLCDILAANYHQLIVSMSLKHKKILLGIGGGIAAYKSADLVRRLQDRGAEVRVVMSQSAMEFITPLTLQALSGHPVASDLLDPAAEAAMGHIGQ